MIIDYDKHSLIFDNKRTLINSAAFLYFRCPGVDPWRDRLSKIKACGYNTVDLYFCWGYHSQKQGVYDFNGIKDIRALLDLTAELGLFVIARPGPFINAELSLGGLPEWLLNIPDIIIRNKKDGDFIYSEAYMKPLKEWYSRIIPIINEYHNIIAFQIENEYFTNEAEPDYLQELYDLARSLGVKAPIFHNDALSVGLYSDIVNIYAFDTYPTINLDYDWKNFPDAFGILDNAESNLADCCDNSPLFIAELQAGWFDKWGGAGYEKIWSQFKKEHINIVTKTALSQGITMFNHYMGCGGTSWDKLASSEVYTSYDFAAPISESGIPRENYYKAKEINYFLNSFNFASTDLISDGADIMEENIFVRLRQDNLNNCKWLFVRNLNNEGNQANPKNFKVLDKYNLIIKPFDMKIMPVELDLNACKIDFSSFEIFGRINKGNHEIIFFIIDENSEIFVSDYEINSQNLNLNIKSTDLKDLDSFKFTKNNKITEFIFINPETADKTWIFDNKVLIGADFLTDNFDKAAFGKDTEVKILNIEADLKEENYSPEMQFKAYNQEINLKTKIVKALQEETLPELISWKSYNCAPEIDVNYDYSNWDCLSEIGKFDCVFNKIYDGYIWYKGSFKEAFDQIEINAKHCYAIYLNGKQIYAYDSLVFEHGNEISETITFNVDKKHLNKTGFNELTVLVQNLGFDKGFQNELIMPRGILSFKTNSCAQFMENKQEPHNVIEWKIRGGLTPLIEEWDFAPENDLENASENSYLTWLSVNFRLEENNNKYNPLFLDLTEAAFNKADIYLNGNLIGKFWKSKGPQSRFYLPEGFLKPENKLSIIVWRKDNSQNNEDYEQAQLYVKIKIGNIKTFSLVSKEELV